MQRVTLIGVDLGMHSFHFHGQDPRGKAVFRRKDGRKQMVTVFPTFYACRVISEPRAGARHPVQKLAEFGH